MVISEQVSRDVEGTMAGVDLTGCGSNSVTCDEGYSNGCISGYFRNSAIGIRRFLISFFDFF